MAENEIAYGSYLLSLGKQFRDAVSDMPPLSGIVRNEGVSASSANRYRRAMREVPLGLAKQVNQATHRITAHSENVLDDLSKNCNADAEERIKALFEGHEAAGPDSGSANVRGGAQRAVPSAIENLPPIQRKVGTSSVEVGDGK